MIVKFPIECSNCPYFKSWESGIMEITCKCLLNGMECDADEEIRVNCDAQECQERF
jgi:hypothetical protein